MAKDEVVILYGSQTGQAEAIAENIHEATVEHDIQSRLLCLSKAEEAFEIITNGDTPIVFVCSTTGDGQVPGNTRKFMRLLKARTLESDHLCKLRYALLGLGDSNFSTFCGGPKSLERALKNLGAKSFKPTGYADDATDLEIVVEPWIEGLWPALKSHLRSITAPIIKGNPTSQPAILGAETSVEEIQSKLLITSLTNENATINISTENDYSNVRSGLEMVTQSRLHENLSEDCEVTMPIAMKPFLKHAILEENVETELPTVPVVPYPLAADDTFHCAKVIQVHQLTADDAVKKALCFTLEIPREFEYEPGDSFGVIIPNRKSEVDWLIGRLRLRDVAEKPLTFDIRPDCTKKNAKVPNYLPSRCTVRYLLERCLEIRSTPKRTFLRVLCDFTSAESDKNILRKLSCKEGMADYIAYIREPGLNMIDILAALSSCHPPLDLLVEHLPRLKARLYSAASCLQARPGRIRFVYNVINFETGDGRMYRRQGLATGTLHDLFLSSKTRNSGSDGKIELRMTGNELTIFRTKNTGFRLPSDQDIPVILIGPGTGVAPFVGFLEYMRFRKSNCKFACETWLFFGCRHEKRDFLFREELESFVSDGTLTRLLVAFSRDGDRSDGSDLNSVQDGGLHDVKGGSSHGVQNGKARNVQLSLPSGQDGFACRKYVTDLMTSESEAIRDLILRKDATLYLCGDAANMAKDVRKALVDILAKEMTQDVAMETVKKLIKDGRYKEDVWI